MLMYVDNEGTSALKGADQAFHGVTGVTLSRTKDIKTLLPESRFLI